MSPPSYYDELADNNEAANANAHEAAENHLQDAIYAGLDVGVPYSCGTGTTTHYPLHSFVGEVEERSAKLLLAACSSALHTLNPERAKETSELLRKFVHSVCSHYADDNSEIFL